MLGVSQIQGAYARTWCSNSHTNHSIIEPGHFFFLVSGPRIWHVCLTEYLQYRLTTLGEDVLLSSMAAWDGFCGKRCWSYRKHFFLLHAKDMDVFFRLTRTTSLSYRSKQNRGSIVWTNCGGPCSNFDSLTNICGELTCHRVFFIFDCTCNMGYLQLLDWFYRLFRRICRKMSERRLMQLLPQDAIVANKSLALGPLGYSAPQNVMSSG